MLERLETRNLLSSSLTGNILNITGTDSANTIGVSLITLGKPGILFLKVTESGLADKSYPQSLVNKIVIKAKGGNDKLSIGPDVKTNCELQGGSGNDTIRGGGGTDALLGQEGDDNLEGGIKNDYLDGGNGVDAVDYSARTSKLTAQLSALSDGSTWTIGGQGGSAGETDSYSYMEAIIGGSGNDTLTSGRSEAGDGPSVAFSLSGGGGNDYLSTGCGGVFVYGVYPDSSTKLRSTIHGGDGDDVIVYSGNVDAYFYGDNGNDQFKNSETEYNYIPHVVEGGAGNDHFVCSTASHEGDGLMKITMHSTLESLSVYNSNGASIEVIGNDYANTIDVGHWEGLGDVTIRGGGGNDSLTVRYDPQEPYAEGVLSAFVQGGSGNDTIKGSDKNDTIEAGDGDDVIYGKEGNDSILCGSGNDKVFGGSGNDRINGGSGKDSIHGDSGSDYITGGSGSDKLFGDSGNDKFYADDSTKDTIDGGSGTDKARRDAIDVLTSIEGTF